MRDVWKRLPPSGLVCLLIVGLWMWRSDTASGLERFWVGMMTISTGFGLWGLARALQTRDWVGDEQIRNPRGDYTNAFSVAQTHVVTHACTLVTTLALLVFGINQAITLPINPGRPPTRGTYVLTVAFLVVGVVKTFLNIYLVYKRDRLVQRVQELGGD